MALVVQVGAAKFLLALPLTKTVVLVEVCFAHRESSRLLFEREQNEAEPSEKAGLLYFQDIPFHVQGSVTGDESAQCIRGE